MSTFFLDIWTFAVSQIGLVALGILLGQWLTHRGHPLLVVDGDQLEEDEIEEDGLLP